MFAHNVKTNNVPSQHQSFLVSLLIKPYRPHLFIYLLYFVYTSYNPA